MAIPGPGPAISIQTIIDEFGGTAPHSLNEYYRGGGLVPDVAANSAVPTSGTISIGNFYGATNRAVISLTISSNTYNYDVYANRSPSYVAGISDIIVTVNPGVAVGSTSTGAYAMLVPSAFNPGDTVTIVNNGTVIGMGGGGGIGAGNPVGALGTPGAGGGNAVYVNRPTIITNNGTLAGGGGGGGGGTGNPSGGKRRFIIAGGGGGGGAGFDGGAGGAGGAAPSTTGTPGSPGTLTAGGAGGPAAAGPGGPGGGQGAAGTAGTPGGFGAGGTGGGAGNYIVGNPFVTYPATGTRLGGVA
jgi:hypothetical protein